MAELSGAPYEMGLAHGRLFGPEIALMRARLTAYLCAVTHGLFGGGFVWSLMQLARLMEPYVPGELKEEMRGLADGSGQPYRFIFLLNALDDVFVNIACSAVAVLPESSADGTLIVGRNLDYPLFGDTLPGLTTVFKVRPDKGRAFVSVGWPGFASVVTGMNESGVFLADLTSITTDKRLRGTPALMLNRIAIQRASSLDELTGILSGARRTVGKNLMAASPEGARVLEVSASRLSVREAAAGEGVLACANHYELADMVDSQGSVKPPPSSDFPAHYYSYEFSKQRMDALGSALSGREGIRPSDVAAALGTAPAANESTVQSVVFVPSSRRLLVAKRLKTPVSQGEYVEVQGL